MLRLFVGDSLFLLAPNQTGACVAVLASTNEQHETKLVFKRIVTNKMKQLLFAVDGVVIRVVVVVAAAAAVAVVVVAAAATNVVRASNCPIKDNIL